MASGSTGFAASIGLQTAHPPIGARVAALNPLMHPEDGRRLGTVEFETPSPAGPPSLEPDNVFASDLCREFSKLEVWAANHSWTVPQVPELCVHVSDRFKISKSLVPAWSGRPGHMEFPRWRVVSRKAAILHELVHVFFPNGNRLLAEGLAIYLQAELGANPAFPNFGRPLHEFVHELLLHSTTASNSHISPHLDMIEFNELDAIATPSPLTLKIGTEFFGEDPRGQKHLYAVAGSFIQHLIETWGLAMFHELYKRTPLLPLQQNAGVSERWVAIYGLSLGELAIKWKLHIARYGELTEH